MILYSYSENHVTIHHTIDRRPNEDDFPMHAHRHCELFYFISGNGYYTVEGVDYAASIAAPIISSGDVLGIVVFLFSDGTKISPTEIKLAQVAASFLGRQMEE